MRENKHRRIAIITPESNDMENEDSLLSIRGIKANPIIKVENGEKRFSYMVNMENQKEQNDVVDLARYFRGYNIIVSIEDRSSFRTNVTDWNNTKESIGYLRGVQKSTAEEKDLYLYDPQTEDYYVFQ